MYELSQNKETVYYSVISVILVYETCILDVYAV